MARDFAYRGKTLHDLKNLSDEEFAKLLTARTRRTVLRGFKGDRKVTMDKIYDAAKLVADGKRQPKVRTHRRDLVIMPNMIGATVEVYNGHKFIPLILQEAMLGHVFGELVPSKKRVIHGSMGIGATGGSRSASVK